MAKKPDLSSIGKKFNLSGIVDNVKSIISPTSISIDAKEDDQIGSLLAKLNELVSEVAAVHQEQEKRLGQISITSAKIYESLQAHVEAAEKQKSDDEPASTEQKKDQADAAAPTKQTKKSKSADASSDDDKDEH